MSQTPLIIDCDPGLDDAVNLVLAFASPEEFDILGVTVVAGNVPLEHTERNARHFRELCGRDEIPVHAGCPRPMVREPMEARHIHGETGIGGLDAPAPAKPLAGGHAVDFLIDTLRAAEPASVTLVPTGPLTNLAAALVMAPDIAAGIGRIVLMGGARSAGGNVTPSAEFNMFWDPHAAHVVLGCGRPVTAFGLDVTHEVRTEPDRVERIRAIGGPVAGTVADMMTFSNGVRSDLRGHEGAPLHDPCTIAFLLRPELFETRPCRIAVETTMGATTFGHTAVDLWEATQGPREAEWATGVDAEGFFDLLCERIARL